MTISLRWRLALAALLIYAPYSWLLLPHENWWPWLRLMPILPFVAIHAAFGALSDFLSLGDSTLKPFGIFCGVVWVAGVLWGCLRLKRALWPFVGTASLISCACGWVIYLLYRA